jgi:hypothetical protein
MSQAPDYVQPVIGWRVWNAVERAGAVSLSSIYYRAIWPPGEPLKAECARRRIRIRFLRSTAGSHAAPSVGCECGIYALALEEIRMMLREIELQRHCPVFGRVSLWGDVHEHERGWRAALAYPERLYVFRPRASQGSVARLTAGLERYGVPVEVLSMSPSDVLDSLCELVPPSWAA